MSKDNSKSGCHTSKLETFQQKSLIKSMKKNAKKFCGHVRSMPTVKTKVARIRKKGGSLTANDQVTANALCENFDNVFVKKDCNEVVIKSKEEAGGNKL